MSTSPGYSESKNIPSLATIESYPSNKAPSKESNKGYKESKQTQSQYTPVNPNLPKGGTRRRSRKYRRSKRKPFMNRLQKQSKKRTRKP